MAMPKAKTIAVLGAGHGGCAAAADLTARGFDVHLHARREASLAPLRQAGGITASGVQNGSFPLALMTTDLAEAVSGADLVMLVVPSVAHEDYAAQLAPLIDGSVPILVNPGHTGGGLHVLAALRRAGYAGPVRIGETVSLTYVARMEGPATVGIYAYASKLRFAALPGRELDALYEECRLLYPELVKASSSLETSLSNMNAIFHPPGMLMNAGWIERTGGDFLFYREGITGAVGAVTRSVDDERLAVAAALGVPTVPFLDIFLAAGLTTPEARATDSIATACEQSEPNRTIKSPPSLSHRYVHEDVGYGLVPISELGRLAGVVTPTIDSLVQIASIANGIDYRSEGLTLARMGLAGLSPDQLSKFLQTGERN